MKINALKIGAQALASVVLGGALVYYNFIDKTVEVDSNKCPDFIFTNLIYSAVT